MSQREWRSVTKADPCPACGKPDWCAWTRDGWLKCERTTDAPTGMVRVPTKDGGGLFKPIDWKASAGQAASSRRASTSTKSRIPSKKRDSVDRAAGKAPVVYPTMEDALRSIGRNAGVWTYRNAAGEPVFLSVRINKPPEADTPQAKPAKKFLPVSLVEGGWIKFDPPGLLLLYHLPELLATAAGSRVYVAEGEKAADAVRALGLIATTSAHGCKAAKKSDWSPLSAREVVILPDHDNDGERYAGDVARLCMEAGAKSVRIVRLVQLWAGMPKGGDMADLLAHRGGDGDSIRAEVEALVGKAEPEAAVPIDGAPVVEFAPLAASDLIREYPDLRPVVIADLLREGETMNVVAAPKVGKSWLIHELAIAVVSGKPWLGKQTSQGAVLLIDGELHRETLARRLRNVQTRLEVLDANMANLKVSPVRGNRWTIDTVAEALSVSPKGTYRIIVIDALYRFLPLDGEENANETMTRVYNTIDKIAKEAGASVVIVHHSNKGDQSGKAVTDVGSGAGSQSRAADTHLILRPHEEEGAVVVDAVVRSFPPMGSFVIQSTNPGWKVAHELDPALLRKPARRGRTAKAEAQTPTPIQAWTPERFAIEIVRRDRSIRADVIARGVAAGLGKGQSESLLTRALDAQLAYWEQDGPSKPRRYTIDPPAKLPNLGGGEVSHSKSTPGADAPGGMGGLSAPPLPPSTPLSDTDEGWGEVLP